MKHVALSDLQAFLLAVYSILSLSKIWFILILVKFCGYSKDFGKLFVIAKASSIFCQDDSTDQTQEKSALSAAEEGKADADGDLAVTSNALAPSECYAVTADYGFKNCKAACMLGWCKSGCLDCTAPAQVSLPSFTGIPFQKSSEAKESSSS